MSQLNRLHQADIDAGNLIDAAHLNAEFNQLLDESNSQDTRLSAVEGGNTTISGNKTFSGSVTVTGTTTLNTVAGSPSFTGQATFAKSPIGVFTGAISAPVYATAASVTIPAGNRALTSASEVITLAASRTVSLAASGAGGLDTGTEAIDTSYYIWLIADSTGANTPHAVFSTSTATCTLPSGYDKRALLVGFFCHNDSASDIVPFTYAGWPYAPKCLYNVTIARPNGTAGPTSVLEVAPGSAATTYTNIDCSKFIPPFSTTGIFFLSGTAGTSSAVITMRPGGQTHDGFGIVQDINEHRYAGYVTPMATSASQVIQYKSNSAAPKVQIAVVGWEL